MHIDRSREPTGGLPFHLFHQGLMKPTPDPRENLQGNEAPARKPAKADREAPAASEKEKPAPASWPFTPGSQGDSNPLPAKPVQRPGWNARQFRI